MKVSAPLTGWSRPLCARFNSKQNFLCAATAQGCVVSIQADNVLKQSLSVGDDADLPLSQRRILTPAPSRAVYTILDFVELAFPFTAAQCNADVNNKEQNGREKYRSHQQKREHRAVAHDRV